MPAARRPDTRRGLGQTFLCLQTRPSCSARAGKCRSPPPSASASGTTASAAPTPVSRRPHQDPFSTLMALREVGGGRTTEAVDPIFRLSGVQVSPSRASTQCPPPDTVCLVDSTCTSRCPGERLSTQHARPTAVQVVEPTPGKAFRITVAARADRDRRTARSIRRGDGSDGCVRAGGLWARRRPNEPSAWWRFISSEPVAARFSAAGQSRPGRAVTSPYSSALRAPGP